MNSDRGTKSTRLTAQQFRAQFETRVTVSLDLHEVMQVEQVLFGYTVYRLLDRLILEDAGQFYIHARPGEGKER